MKKFLLSILAINLLASCGGNAPKQESNQENNEQKSIVIYYSQNGTTQKVAECIKEETNSQIESLELVEPYSGDFNQTIERCQKEMAENKNPELKTLKNNLEDYQIIYLGYPVWFGTYALPIKSFLENNNLEGKTIIPFMTFGSGGNTSYNNLKETLKNSTVKNYFGIRTLRIEKAKEEVHQFLAKEGLIDAQAEEKEDFEKLEVKEVSQEQIDIFNQACSDYQFPLGTPEKYSIRQTNSSTDYLFYVVNNNKDGSQSNSKIIVTISNKENSKAEFTEVIR